MTDLEHQMSPSDMDSGIPSFSHFTTVKHLLQIMSSGQISPLSRHSYTIHIKNPAHSHAALQDSESSIPLGFVV
ncbi:hypothetical protein DUNSADRAFT_18729 [Dunaliella salina]|uniref:Uncharacterized protein n=1 Tax=Dunaliella salina TaxID=3046 RepID=A0ABQ7GYP8_DUNSA|nr:hypothetical protein DUNSADRAFT_18729 [Dunaliella salina]|eukprot:KAF5839729.1 hypothetical protein DUNSADRAFT_18729 [Dunaliella salina]